MKPGKDKKTVISILCVGTGKSLSEAFILASNNPQYDDRLFIEFISSMQAFLDFRVLDFCSFRFTAVYNSILFSFPLVLLSNLDLRGFCFRGFLFISSINRGMPVC